MAKKWTQTTDEQFEVVKQLAAAGLNDRLIAKAIGKSDVTVFKMRKAGTREAYLKAESDRRQRYIDKAKGVVEEKPAPAEVTPEPVSSPLSQEAVNNQQFDWKLLNENIVLLGEKLEKYTNAVNDLTIATYSLRKTVNGDKTSYSSTPAARVFWKQK